ncbi:MAG TPA: four helix bundle protein [Caldithrix abyssi]|uniref:Four helix bundle protein n=1 Tax=Caldithrix abyssi TaxID=187145 RepID=A0A7V4TYG7_CALAY|nr:four helix bundle protein [Caldithrix abyssi]
MFKELSEIEVYTIAESFSNDIWQLVIKWDTFSKDTVGKQLVRAADSISANIAESHGRFHYRDKSKFGYYARGSYEETKSWLRKAIKRNLFTKDQSKDLIAKLEAIGPRLNALINSYKQS